ncbi:alpha/beta fold hydrolase [Nocardia gipuzkoensis]|uniref:alpha/beta fold hydrolase n=1 Tax=Nocardia gipuzkoensis TaxID=2749991 RepID=UPI001E54F408|nr:alpha/beta hydrolase [Nocardia gipuzkoensis]UGT71305.1 alpha/beta fold hydrolase [Nocardia gipuzkoensis]
MTKPIAHEGLIRVSAEREIFYADTRTPGPVVVLLHGGGPGAFGVSNYSRNIDALASSFRVIVPDLPGYGRSTKGVDRDDPFGDLATSMRGLLDALDIERAHFLGNSLGGACALRLALDSPQRVDKLVLMGPGGIGTTRSLPTAGLNHLLSYYTGEGPTLAKVETFIRDYLVYDGSSIPQELIEARYMSSIERDVLAHPPLRRPSGPLALRKVWRMDFTRDSRLKSLTTPTLVIWGTEDKVNRPEGGRMLARTLPNCDLLMLSRTGHWAQWERADLFNTVIRAWLLDES